MTGPWGPNSIRHYNLSPGMAPQMMHTQQDGKPLFEQIYWGYRPPWAKEKGLPPSINARIETAATKPYFRHMFREGRIIVPADGWYEWTKVERHKQPWYIRLKSDRPLFLAAISNFRPRTFQTKEVGFVIVTAAADAGLLDVHDRRPVVFDPQDARIWMDNSLPPEQAEQLARNRSLPPESFEWYRVSSDVNNARHNEPYLIEPIEQTD